MFRILIYDNSQYQERNSATVLPQSFSTEAEAVSAATEILKKSLEDVGHDFRQYTMFGVEPVIEGPSKVAFSAWHVARTLCHK